MSKKTKRAASREKEFKARLKNFFPGVQFELVYSPINYKHNRSEKIKAEGTFGYHKKESVLVDGKPVGIAWLPHIKDMTESNLNEILKRVENAVWEILDDDLDDDSDIASLGAG